VTAVTIDLTSIGDFAWDVLIRTNSELLHGGDTFGEVMLLPGGSAANVAVWATRCGLPARFVGKVGTDRLGQMAHENLAAEGVVDDMIDTESHLTGSVGVFVDHTGERSMVSGHGADHFLLPSELPRDILVDSRHLHLTAWSFFVDPPRAAAREAAHVVQDSGGTLSFDPSSFQLIDEMGVDAFLEVTTDLGIDIFLPNKEEGAVLSGETEPLAIAQCLAELYKGAQIILKLDAEGALLYLDGETHHVPPATNNLVDATGAGDSFAGAYLARTRLGASEVEAANFACQVAAWVIARLGARPQGDRALQALLAQR
jgi:sugar/nucleoside kinase (ribokinase family)